MLKLIGASLIIASGTWWGLAESQKLSARVSALEKIIFAIKLLESEITYGKRDIKNTLRNIGRNYGPEFLFYASERVDELGIKEALYQEMNKYGYGFLGTDKSSLETLWENLGMTDSESQVKTIRHVLGVLENNKEAAREEFAKYGSLKRSMGILGGIFTAIILL